MDTVNALETALDALRAALDEYAPECHGMEISFWYSSNDGCWKYDVTL